MLPKDRREALRTNITVLATVFLVMAAIFTAFKLVLNISIGNIVLGELLPPSLINIIFYVFFFLLIFSSTVSAIGSLFTAESVDIFLAAPIAPWRLFLGKVIEITIETGFMFLVICLPIGLAYSVTFGLGASFLLSSAAATIPLLISTTAIGIVFGTVFSRISSYIWHRGYIFLIALIGAFIWGSNRILDSLVGLKMNRGSSVIIAQTLGLFDNPNPLWLPSRWTADIVNSAFSTPSPFVRSEIALLISSSAGLLALAFLVFDRLFFAVRSAAAAQRRVEEDRSSIGSNKADIAHRFFDSLCEAAKVDQQRKAIIVKDLCCLIRDRGQALQMLFYLGFVAIYSVLFRFMNAAFSIPGFYSQLSWASCLAGINILFAGFIITALMNRLVYPSVSLEGKSLWLLLVAPIEIEQLIRAKFWCWLPFTLAVTVSLLYVGLAAIGFSITTAVLSTVIGCALSIGIAALSISIGATYARFEWESPNQISAGLGTLSLLLKNLLLVLITTVPSLFLIFFALLPADYTTRPVLKFLTMCLLLAIIILVNLTVAQRALSNSAKMLRDKLRA